MIRSLEVISEATKRIPKAVREKCPDIPWTKMAGMRDILIHDYMGVDLKTVWKVIQERLSFLKPILDKLQIGNKSASPD